MIWQDLQNDVIDLGFEEDATYTEYRRIIINNCNRAIQVINSTVIPKLKDYLEGKWGREETDENGNTTWVFPAATHITSNTANSEIIEFPEQLLPLVPLLAAHYIWLDDDLTKASIYWNEYDDLKNQIIEALKTPYKCRIEGGF